MLASLFNLTLHKGMVPADWSTTIIYRIVNKGDLNDARKSHPANLACTIYKVIAKKCNAASTPSVLR